LPIRCYQFLADAFKDFTNSKNPEQDATKVLKHILKKYPETTHVVLCANQDTNSPDFGTYRVVSVGSGQEFEKPEDYEGAYIIDPSGKHRYPVAYVEVQKGW
jgi:hypothetical protein